MEQKRMQSCIHFMNLKKLNRLAHMRLKRGRDQTHEVTATGLSNAVKYLRGVKRSISWGEVYTISSSCPLLCWVGKSSWTINTLLHPTAAATVSKEKLKHPWVYFCLECIDPVLEPAYSSLLSLNPSSGSWCIVLHVTWVIFTNKP